MTFMDVENDEPNALNVKIASFWTYILGYEYLEVYFLREDMTKECDVSLVQR